LFISYFDLAAGFGVMMQAFDKPDLFTAGP
jgi:hypothetical protein